MSKRYDQTDLRPFKSIYKEGHVTVDNYIAELFFQRRAKFRKEALPQQFWNVPKYKKLYVIQIIHINRLLERVSSAAIIKAIGQTNACSILNKELVALIEKIQAEMDANPKEIEQTVSVEIKAPSTPYGKINRLSEL